MTERRVTIAGVYRALGRFDLDPVWVSPIAVAHRCPGCGAAAETIEHEVSRFVTYCDCCAIQGPAGFEEMARRAVQRATRGAA